MSSNLPAILGAFVSDGLSLFQIPGSGAAGVGLQLLLEDMMRRREEGAREILIEELRKGRKTEQAAISEDEAAAILFRYLRAAQEGAARRNLRLLAQVIRGQLEGGSLVADRFLSLADILGSLKREEIVLAGAMLKADNPPAFKDDEFDSEAYWKKVKENPAIVATFGRVDGTLEATGWALTRCGFVFQKESNLIPGYLTPSPLLHEVGMLCDFEAAARES